MFRRACISNLEFGARRRPKLDQVQLDELRGRSGEFQRIQSIPVFQQVFDGFPAGLVFFLQLSNGFPARVAGGIYWPDSGRMGYHRNHLGEPDTSAVSAWLTEAAARRKNGKNRARPIGN